MVVRNDNFILLAHLNLPLQKGLGQKATGQNMKITNRLNEIRRIILFLDIQKLNISVGRKSIQIRVVATIG